MPLIADLISIILLLSCENNASPKQLFMNEEQPSLLSF